MALCACTRAGFASFSPRDASLESPQTNDGKADGSALPSNAVFISPTGDDSNPGTADAPWRTWSHALSQLSPGDTLIALPGVYGAATGTGYLRLDCGESSTACDGEPCAQGTSASPITVMAQTERTALLKAEIGAGRPMQVRDCSYWRFIGLRSENIDDPDNTMDNGFPLELDACDHITLKRILAAHPNRYFNTKVFHIKRSSNVLVEECEAYDFHRSGFVAYQSEGIVFRRNYANSRLIDNIPGGYESTCSAQIPTSSTGISLYGADNCIAENNVVENVCRGFHVSYSDQRGDNNILTGNIVMGVFYYGFMMESSCGGQDPCVDENHILNDNSFTNNLILGGRIGHYFRGAVGTTVSHVSAVDYQDSGFAFDLNTENAGLAATVAVTSSLAFTTATDADKGFVVKDHETWSIVYSNAYGNLTNYSPATTEPTNGSYDPLLEASPVCIPQGSPGKGAGEGESDVGANIVFRSENNTLIPEGLWDPSTGQFPCGAMVAGVNDNASFPDSACVNVHLRLNVGSSRCAIP